MKRINLALIGSAMASVLVDRAPGQTSNVAQLRFQYELFNAQNGALYKATTGNTHANDLVHAVLVDSRNWVFVGSQNGLAIFDGSKWTNRTFKIKGVSSRAGALLGALGISECGPEQIAEGPPGTIWLGGSGCGVWRYRNGRYEEISSSPVGDSYLGMAVDNGGSLWVVTRDNAQKYDGNEWSKVLAPYLANAVHRELPQLFRIAIETNGNIWIGGTQYGDPQPPWEHDGTAWLVAQSQNMRGAGPPMAGLYEFDGKGWRAFGPPHGLAIQSRETVIPRLDAKGRVIAELGNALYVREGETWKLINSSEADAGRKWILKGLSKGQVKAYYAELLFRDGDQLVHVEPREQRTGKILDLGAEPLRVLRMAEDVGRDCIWLGTMHGLYRIWREKDPDR